MNKKLIISMLFLLCGISVFAQNTTAGQEPAAIPQLLTNPLTYITVFTLSILLGTILVMVRVIKLLTWQIAGAPVRKVTEEQTVEKQKRESFWSKLNRKLSGAVPVEKEADVLLDHNYDGIRELDNNLPPWWVYGFYITIVFAVIYLVHYHVAGSGNVQLDEYNQQLAEAALIKEERLKMSAANVDETTATVLNDEKDLADGKKIFTEKCIVCHGSGGEGNVGPNLTDDYWIHGGGIKDIFGIIKYGFPSKGMLAWQGQLTPVQIQQVASYVKHLKGTNPPNQKAPQGDLYNEIPDSTNSEIALRDTLSTQQ